MDHETGANTQADLHKNHREVPSSHIPKPSSKNWNHVLWPTQYPFLSLSFRNGWRNREERKKELHSPFLGPPPPGISAFLPSTFPHTSPFTPQSSAYCVPRIIVLASSDRKMNKTAPVLKEFRVWNRNKDTRLDCNNLYNPHHWREDGGNAGKGTWRELTKWV